VFNESRGMMTVEQLEQADPTAEAVLDWRFEQLQRVGYDRREARLLSRRVDIDLHLAVDLLRDGCPHELALEILL
jgi:hypothetical protein